MGILVMRPAAGKQQQANQQGIYFIHKCKLSQIFCVKLN
jgi:hypothetical protein